MRFEDLRFGVRVFVHSSLNSAGTCRIWGLGLGAWGLEGRVEGLGLRVEIRIWVGTTPRYQNFRFEIEIMRRNGFNNFSM